MGLITDYAKASVAVYKARLLRSHFLANWLDLHRREN